MELKLLHFGFKTLDETKRFVSQIMKNIEKPYVMDYRLVKVKNKDDKQTKYKTILYFNQCKSYGEKLDAIFAIAKKFKYTSYEKIDN